MTTERIDSHHHLWRYDPVEYSWITEGMSAIRRDFTPEDLFQESGSNGIFGFIAVQARQSLDETWALLEAADKHPAIRAVVGWAALSGPDLERILPTVAGHPKLKGIRHIVQDEPDPDYILREDFNRGVSALKPFHLVYDILIYERHLPQAIEFVDRHPDQVFVLDHIAKPRIRDREISPWRERLREIARRPNVYCKLSGVVTEAGPEWTEQDLRPYIDTAIEAFTPQRLMFGSDWPVCLLRCKYGRWVEVIENSISQLTASERDRIWAGTAREAYGLEPESEA
jgi:L-fuconolactonase